MIETDKLPTGKALIVCRGYTANPDGTFDVHGSCGGVVSPFVPSPSKRVKAQVCVYTEAHFPRGLAGTGSMSIVGYWPDGNEVCRVPGPDDDSLDGRPEKILVNIWKCEFFFWQLGSVRLELWWGDRVLASCDFEVVGPDNVKPGRLVGVATAATPEEIEQLIASQPKAETTAA